MIALNQVFEVGAKSSKPIQVEVFINNKPLFMEDDTGAAVSIISQTQQKTNFRNIALKPSNIHLKTYTGERMEVVGEARVDVRHYSPSHCGSWKRSCTS